MKNVTIAIDGYSSCGKSTLAKELAQQFNYRYIDSGAMYRAVTLYLINKGILKDGAYLKKAVIDALPEINIEFRFNKDKRISETFLNDTNVEKDIRTMFISNQVSQISAISEVRGKLVQLQKQMSASGAVVMDGRDIGTVVFPDAEVKLFMTADTDVRTERRLLELEGNNQKSTFDEVKDNLTKRDYMDMNRAVSPLKQAEDAVVIDNSEITKEEQLKIAIDIINQKINN